MSKRRLLVGTSALVLALSSSAALAQTGPETPSTGIEQASTVDEIVVTGIRRSLQEAVEIKKNADVISDVISAEDIGKFPDQNMAESLQRITGVQITRSRGEGQNVTVRGLDPKFSQVQFNGRSLPSASGSRSFDFTILSSDFVTALEVYKTPTADMEEGGLAATINVRTLSPLDLGRRSITMNAEAIYEENSKATTPHYSGIFSDTFADGVFGLAIGGDYSKRDVQVDRYEAFGFENTTEAAKNFDANGDGDRNDAFAFNHAANYGSDIGERERKSVFGTLEWRPNDAFRGYVNGLYSRFDNTTLFAVNAHRFTNIDTAGGGGYVSTVEDSNRNLTYLDANRVDHRNNARTDEIENTLKSLAVGGTWTQGPWTVSGEVAAATSQRIASSLSLEVIGRANVFQDLRDDPDGPATLAYDRGYDPMNASNFRATSFNGDLRRPSEDKTKDARFDVKYDVDRGWISEVSVGLKYSDRSHHTDSRRIAVSGQQLAALLGVAYDPLREGGSFDASPYMRQFGGSGFLGAYDGSSTFPTTWLSADPALLYRDISLERLEAASPPTQNLPDIATITEKALAAYARVDFRSPDERLSGNFGVRIVDTKQTSEGYAPDFSQTVTYDLAGSVTSVSAVNQVSVDRSYTNILPSLNVRYEINEDLYLRAGAARVMARPDFSVLSPATTINANIKSISAGNPEIDPYLANQFDLSLEWYPGGESLISAAIFYKDVDSFIVATQRDQILNVQIVGGAAGPEVFRFNQPGNGDGGVLKGIELGFQMPFTFLPSPFDGFGVIANYTLINADDVATVQGETPLPLAGVSKSNYNLVGYYENARFGARLSYNYRDDFVVDAQSFFGDGAFTKGYGQLDFSANVSLTDAISLTADALNLTNEAIVQVNRFGFNRGYEDNGRRLTVGLRARF